MKSESEIRDIFDGFINCVKEKMMDSARLFHKHDNIVGWDKATPSELHKIEEHLRMYRDLMAMKDAAETLKKTIFGNDEKEEEK